MNIEELCTVMENGIPGSKLTTQTAGKETLHSNIKLRRTVFTPITVSHNTG